jgi:carboxypeptidase Taq
MYAADQYSCLKKGLPLSSLLENGEIEPIRNWLKESIHGHGSCLTLKELLMQSTKQPLSADRYFTYLKERFLIK